MNKANKNLKITAFEICVVVALAVLFLVSGLFFNSYKETKALYNIDRTNVDFIIQEPSRAQVEEIKGLSHVDKIVPYIYYSINVACKEEISTNLFIVDSKEEIANTVFSDSLLLKKSEKAYNNELYISDDFAKASKLGIGDEVSITVCKQSITFNVAAIYESDHRFVGGTVMAVMENDLKDAVIAKSGSEYKYSGAYINSSDVSATTLYLEDYEPLANLKTREDFATDELYQFYLDSREKTDYTLTTFYKQIFMKDISSRNDSDLKLNLALALVVAFVCSFAVGGIVAFKTLRYAKTEVQKDINDGYSVKQEVAMFISYFSKILILNVCVSIVLSFVNMLIFKNGLINPVSLIGVLATSFVIALVWIMSVRKIKKKFSK